MTERRQDYIELAQFMGRTTAGIEAIREDVAEVKACISSIKADRINIENRITKVESASEREGRKWGAISGAIVAIISGLILMALGG